MTKKLWAYYLILLQFLDGIFTWWGVTCLGHGTDAEGNPVVKYVMDSLGVEPGLLLVKGLAILIICFLFKYWSTRIMTLIGLIYSIVVGIWFYVFLIHNHFI
jgi:hypothetical protein